MANRPSTHGWTEAAECREQVEFDDVQHDARPKDALTTASAEEPHHDRHAAPVSTEKRVSAAEVAANQPGR